MREFRLARFNERRLASLENDINWRDGLGNNIRKLKKEAPHPDPVTWQMLSLAVLKKSFREIDELETFLGKYTERRPREETIYRAEDRLLDRGEGYIEYDRYKERYYPTPAAINLVEPYPKGATIGSPQHLYWVRKLARIARVVYGCYTLVEFGNFDLITVNPAPDDPQWWSDRIVTHEVQTSDPSENPQRIADKYNRSRYVGGFPICFYTESSKDRKAIQKAIEEKTSAQSAAFVFPFVPGGPGLVSLSPNMFLRPENVIVSYLHDINLYDDLFKAHNIEVKPPPLTSPRTPPIMESPAVKLISKIKRFGSI